jgi:hypothetical protein
VIRRHDDVDRVEDAPLLETAQQAAEHVVHALDRAVQLGRIRPEAVSRRVYVAHVEGDERRSHAHRKVEPREHLIDALAVGPVVLVRHPMSRPHPAYGRLRPRPEHRRGRPAGALDGVPDGIASPPHRIRDLLAFLHREEAPGSRIAHRVSDDAMVAGIEARDERVVIRKGFGREARDEPVGANAAGHQAAQIPDG